MDKENLNRFIMAVIICLELHTIVSHWNLFQKNLFDLHYSCVIYLRSAAVIDPACAKVGSYQIILSDSLQKIEGFGTELCEQINEISTLTQRIEEVFGLQVGSCIKKIILEDGMLDAEGKYIPFASAMVIDMESYNRLRRFSLHYTIPIHETLHAVDFKLEISSDPRWQVKLDELMQDTTCRNQFAKLFYYSAQNISNLNSEEFFAYFTTSLFTSSLNQIIYIRTKNCEKPVEFVDRYVNTLCILWEISCDKGLENTQFAEVIKTALFHLLPCDKYNAMFSK